MERAAKVLLHLARKVERGCRLTNDGCAAFDDAVSVLLGDCEVRLGEIDDPGAILEVAEVAMEFAREVRSGVFTDHDLERIRQAGSEYFSEVDSGIAPQESQPADRPLDDEGGEAIPGRHQWIADGAAQSVIASLHPDPFTGLLFRCVVDVLVEPVHEIKVSAAKDLGSSLMETVYRAARPHRQPLPQRPGRIRRVRRAAPHEPLEPAAPDDVSQAPGTAPEGPAAERNGPKLGEGPGHRPQAGGIGPVRGLW